RSSERRARAGRPDLPHRGRAQRTRARDEVARTGPHRDGPQRIESGSLPRALRRGRQQAEPVRPRLMAISLKAAATVVAVAIVLGFLIAKRHEVFHEGKDRGPAAFAAVPHAPPNRRVRSSVRARELRILDADQTDGETLRTAPQRT